jgi:hypothetical protein
MLAGFGRDKDSVPQRWGDVRRCRRRRWMHHCLEPRSYRPPPTPFFASWFRIKGTHRSESSIPATTFGRRPRLVGRCCRAQGPRNTLIHSNRLERIAGPGLPATLPRQRKRMEAAPARTCSRCQLCGLFSRLQNDCKLLRRHDSWSVGCGGWRPASTARRARRRRRVCCIFTRRAQAGIRESRRHLHSVCLASPLSPHNSRECTRRIFTPRSRCIIGHTSHSFS